MKRTLGSMRIFPIVAACAAAVACRDHRQPPSEASVSLTSASIATPDTPALQQSSESPPDPAVCQPSDEEAAATPPSSVTPARASRGRVAHAAPPKPNRALNDAIAGAITHEERNATPPESAPEEIGTNVTTTSATMPAAPAPSLAPARVIFENRLPSGYDLERVRMLVDGAVAYDARTPGSVWIAPGPHAVQVIASYRLNDPLLTYVRDYRINMQSTEQVPASATSLAVVATARPKGGVTAPIGERAGVAWRSFPIQ